MRFKLWATAVALGVALVGGGVTVAAHAYPPGKHLQVSAVSAGVDHQGRQRFIASVSQAQPGCAVRISLGSAAATTTVGASGSASVTLTQKLRPGAYAVAARTVKCATTESAVTQIVVVGRTVGDIGTVKSGHRFKVTVKKWLPKRTVQFWATNGSVTVSRTVVADAKGTAVATLTLSKKGTWAVVIAQGGHTATLKVKVV